MRQLEVADFIHGMPRQMRFGELACALLRRMRPAPQSAAGAMSIRNLVFDAMSGIECAVLRIFRQPVREPPEVIHLGMVCRYAPVVHRLSSLVVRAQL